MASICVFLETANGRLKKSAAEVLGEAKRLAGGGDVDAVLVGEGVAALSGEVSELGATRVLVAEGEALARFSVDGYGAALEKAVASSSPRALLMAASVVGISATGYRRFSGVSTAQPSGGSMR